MKYFLALALILSFPMALLASDYRGECTVVFQGNSTLHGFQGKTRCLPFTASKADGALVISKISVAVADMDTGNGKRDKKMREMFEEKKFPLITGVAAPVSLNDIRNLAGKGGNSAAKIKLNLKIRDVEKPVTATVTNLVESDSLITADVAFTLSLAEYHLQPPSVLGLIKVDDKVSLKANVVLHAQ